MKGIRLLPLLAPGAALAATGVAELGRMIFFMLYVLPALLLLLSVVTLLLSRKLGARRGAMFSIVGLVAALCITVFHGILLFHPLGSDANGLGYLVVSAGLAMALILAEGLLCIGLVVWRYTRTKGEANDQR